MNLAALDRHIAAVVAGGRILFVARLVLLIDDEQAGVGHRGEDRAARADHHIRLTGGDLLPIAVPGRLRQAAVQHGHLRETRDEPLDRLRGQRDLRHEHHRLLPPCHRLGDEAQVNLRLAAAGHAQEQMRPKATLDHRWRDGIERRLLLDIERVRLLGHRPRIHLAKCG